MLSKVGTVARLIKLLVTLLVGIGLGLALTEVAMSGRPPFGAVRSGAWRAWPGIGTADVDPYARAVMARTGAIPLAAAVGVAFLADRDDAGRVLDGRCSYEIAGPTPSAQFWTLTLLDPTGFPLKTGAERSGFTSTEMVRDAKGGFAVQLAPTARPGNWLPLSGGGPFMLLASFYDTPLTAALEAGAAVPILPAIVRQSCP